MTPPRMLDLSDVIAKNRQLQILNLSWNSFTQYFSMKDYYQGVDEAIAEDNKDYIAGKDSLINSGRDISIIRTISQQREGSEDANSQARTQSAFTENSQSMRRCKNKESQPVILSPAEAQRLAY